MLREKQWRLLWVLCGSNFKQINTAWILSLSLQIIKICFGWNLQSHVCQSKQNENSLQRQNLQCSSNVRLEFPPNIRRQNWNNWTLKSSSSVPGRLASRISCELLCSLRGLLRSIHSCLTQLIIYRDSDNFFFSQHGDLRLKLWNFTNQHRLQRFLNNSNHATLHAGLNSSETSNNSRSRSGYFRRSRQYRRTPESESL